MDTETFINSRVSILQRASLFGLIAAFVVAGSFRLNDCDLFNPDSPRYVIYSQAIVNLGEYRAIDVPGSPLYSWRPPGLSLLLAPMMAIRPYDVVAAKAVVLSIGALLLWFTFELTLLYSGAWSAIVITAFIASGPTFLVLSTEVLSEMPYTLGVLIVLQILCRSTFPVSGDGVGQNRMLRFLPFGIAVLTMAFVPWLRTAGVALVVAVGIWSITSRLRFKWLSVALAGVVGLALLAIRNKQAGGENYVGSLASRLSERGPGPVIASGIETIRHYVSTFPGLLLPGLTNERPWYAPLTLDGLPKLGLPDGVANFVAALLFSVAILGMWKRRANGGSLAFLYVAIYSACLILWPWRHERFLWPLFPVIMAFVAAGFSATIQKISNAGQRGISIVAAISMIMLCGWQAVSCDQLIRVNHEFVKDREAFYANRYPSFYFSDWRRAGTWLDANTLKSARILTWHAAVAETAHRFQKRVQFETSSPEKIRQQIEGFSARYLVIPGAQFGDGFGWQQLTADPAIRLQVVYEENDVVILEVEPNRTGEVSKTAYAEFLEKQMKLSDDARGKLPQRTDVAVRYASLLRECGREDDAIQVLKDLVSNGTKTVRVCAELGWMFFDKGEFAEAAKFLDLARTLPNAESIAGQLSDGVAHALERLREKRSPNAQTPIEQRLQRVKSLMGGLKYAAAEREIERIVVAAPENSEVIFIRGKLHHRLGELSQAADCYERAFKSGSAEAEEWLLQIRLEEAVAAKTVSTVTAGSKTESIDPADPAAHVRLAVLLRDHGWAGRALAVLEEANSRFPNRSSIQSPLADLYRTFARPELAVPLYESVLTQDSNDEASIKGLNAAKFSLLEPDFTISGSTR